MADNNNYKEVDFNVFDTIGDAFLYLRPEIELISKKLDSMDQSDVCATLCTILAKYVRNHPEVEKETFYFATALTLLESMTFEEGE